MGKLLILAGMALLTAAQADPPKDIKIASGENGTPLLELFTSEGCSSCPPAEEWFSSLCDSPDLWRRFVPVSFHVDYWNHLGWTDPNSSPEWSARQRTYAGLLRSQSVYTPEFFLNGREWRIGENIPLQAKGGLLKLRITGNRTLLASYQPASRSSGPFQLNVAPLSCGLDQKISRGENAGRTLRHDFVALMIEQAPLTRDDHDHFTATLSVPTGVAARMKAIAAWVTLQDSPTPIQAAGGWIK